MMADGESSGLGMVLALGLGFGAGALVAVLMEPRAKGPRDPFDRPTRTGERAIELHRADLPSALRPKFSGRYFGELASEQAWYELGRKGWPKGPYDFEGVQDDSGLHTRVRAELEAATGGRRTQRGYR